MSVGIIGVAMFLLSKISALPLSGYDTNLLTLTVYIFHIFSFWIQYLRFCLFYCFELRCGFSGFVFSLSVPVPSRKHFHHSLSFRCRRALVGNGCCGSCQLCSITLLLNQKDRKISLWHTKLSQFVMNMAGAGVLYGSLLPKKWGSISIIVI